MPPTVAIMSPGDMGHAVASVLGQGGLRVITRLDGRSVQREGCVLPLRSDLNQTVPLEWEKCERGHAPSC